MVFGKLQTWFHSIEWQNVVYHTVIGCHSYQLVIGLIYINDVICTQIPEPSIDFELHPIVMPNMVHGPSSCISPNNPCMQDGHCSKR